MGETAQFQGRYQRDETTNGTGNPHVIRDEMKAYNSTIAFIFDPNPTGTGKFQVTYERDLNLIKSDPGSVEWVDWPPGNKATHQEDLAAAVFTGWRLVANTGNVRGQVRGGF